MYLNIIGKSQQIKVLGFIPDSVPSTDTGWEDQRRRSWQKSAPGGVVQSSWAVTLVLCRALAELCSMVGRKKQGLFLDHILMEKMSHQPRQETQGGVSSRVRGIPLEWIAGFLHFLKRLFQMSLSAGLSNKQPGVSVQQSFVFL